MTSGEIFSYFATLKLKQWIDYGLVGVGRKNRVMLHIIGGARMDKERGRFSMRAEEMVIPISFWSDVIIDYVPVCVVGLN